MTMPLSGSIVAPRRHGISLHVQIKSAPASSVCEQQGEYRPCEIATDKSTMNPGQNCDRWNSSTRHVASDPISQTSAHS
ncbi:MAG: hypothetical protein ACJZ9G_06790 [Rhodospirillales bacterium]